MELMESYSTMRALGNVREHACDDLGALAWVLSHGVLWTPVGGAGDGQDSNADSICVPAARLPENSGCVPAVDPYFSLDIKSTKL